MRAGFRSGFGRAFGLGIRPLELAALVDKAGHKNK